MKKALQTALDPVAFGEYLKDLEDLAKIENATLSAKELKQRIDNHYLLAKKTFHEYQRQILLHEYTSAAVKETIAFLRGKGFSIDYLCTEVLGIDRTAYYAKTQHHTWTELEADRLVGFRKKVENENLQKPKPIRQKKKVENQIPHTKPTQEKGTLQPKNVEKENQQSEFKPLLGL